jgi:hypothetical protein
VIVDVLVIAALKCLTLPSVATMVEVLLIDPPMNLRAERLAVTEDVAAITAVR